MIKQVLLVLVLTGSLNAQILEYSALSDTIPLKERIRGMKIVSIDSVYSSVAEAKDIISFDDCNICKSRAHITARVIENRFPAVRVAKVWLFADSKRKSQADVYRYKRVVHLDNDGKCSKWSYHVAPVIITANDTFVIDPSTQTAPAKLRDWAVKLIPAGGKAFIVIKDKQYFIYPESGNDLFEDQKAVWSDDNKNLYDEEYSRSIDEVVRASLGIVEPWKMNAKVKQIKELLESP